MKAAYKTNDWRGKVQPRRDKCPKCSKRGLGAVKTRVANIQPQGSVWWAVQVCRYCKHEERVK